MELFLAAAGLIVSAAVLILFCYAAGGKGRHRMPSSGR